MSSAGETAENGERLTNIGHAVMETYLHAAVEDKLISSNPVKSRRVKISGNASRATTPYSVEQMRYLVSISAT